VFQVTGDTSCTLSTFHVDTEIDPTPYIALTVDGLWCPLPGTYQWFLNDTAIPGATGAYHVPVEDGLYTVSLTNPQGCSTLSYPFDWSSTVIGTSSSEEMTLHFSPQEAILRLRGAQGRQVLTVTDAAGRLVFSTELNGPDKDISMANAARGIYMARISDRLFRFVR